MNMDIFSRRLSALCLLLATALASAQAPDIRSAGLPGSRVDELLVLARRQNADLAASGFELEAAQARVHSAAALPDPIGRLELRDVTNRADNGSFNLLPGRVGSTRYTLAQTFPWWGKRDLKRQVAEADAAQAEARRASAWSELAAKVKTGFAQYYLAGHSLQLNGELLRLAETLERLAQARYAGGLAAQQDVIRAQVEKSNLRGERLRLESESRQTAARLNGLLRRPPTAPLAEARVLRPLPSAEQLADGALSARLLAANPQLAAQEAQLLAAETSGELVRKNRYPDVTIGVSPIQVGSRVAEWELMFEVNIPLARESRRAQESEALALAAAARARKEAVANQVAADLAENVAALEAARRLEQLIASALLPQAEIAFKAALAGYETGRLDFATLLETQRQIRQARLDRLRAQTEAQIRLAEIERLLGEDL